MGRKSKSRRTSDAPANAPGLARWLRPGCLACASALLVATPLIPSERTELTGAALPFVMLWLLLALVWFAGAALLGVPLGRIGWVDAMAVALAGWHAVSGLVMMHYGAPRLTINAMWTWVSFAVIVVLLRQLLRDAREVKSLCAVMIALAVGLSAIGLHQAYITYPLQRMVYEQHPDAALQAAGVHAPEGSAARNQFEARLYSSEPTATFSLTNSLAGFLAPWLIVLLGIAVARRASREPTARAERQSPRSSNQFWIALIAGGLLITVCLLLTKSRTAWLATLFGCASIAAVVLWRRGLRKQLAIAAGVVGAIVAAAALLTALNVIPNRFALAAAQSFRYRLEYWQSTAAMIGDYPLFGCGPGNFQDYFATYKLPQASETVSDPHNFAFEIAATAGLPALLIAAGLIAVVANGALKRNKDEADENGAESPPNENCDENVQSADAWIFAGLPLGMLLAVPLSLVVDQPVMPTPLLWGGACAGVVLWLLRTWVRDGALPRWLPPLAGVVLLINLLAAGGISFPGVAMTLWVLIAVMTINKAGRAWRPSPVAALVLIAPLAVGLLLTCYSTGYRPVLQRILLMAKAQDAVAGAPRLGSLSLARDFTTAIDYAEQAAVGDRWSAQPHLLQARIYANNWSEPLDRDVADRTKCESQCGQALALDRHSDQTEAAVGYLMLLIAENFGYQHSFDYDASYLQRAIEHFEAAAKLYPNDAMTHANLAMVYNLLDENDPRAVAAANEALRLDDLCPHEERKLANRRLFEEISAAARDDVLYDASGRYIASQTAKQWMLEIRNNAGKHLPAPQSPISHLRSPISHLPESKATP